MAGKRKLISLSKVKPRDEEMEEMLDSARYRMKKSPDRVGIDILLEAQQYWDAMARFRKERDRCKRYCYGDQWGDYIQVGCKTMTEEQYIEKQGKPPLKNNLIRRLVKNVIGVYRGQNKEPTCVARDRDEQTQSEIMSTVLQYNWQKNRIKEINARSFEEFLISGLVVQRKSYGWRNNTLDCWTDYVQPNNFIIDNNGKDFRGWDISFIGQIHDVSFEDVMEDFAKSPADCDILRREYSLARSKGYVTNYWASDFGYSRMENVDFFLPSDSSRCRVIEIWRKESKERYRCVDYLNGEIFKVDKEDLGVLVTLENERRIKEGLDAGMDRNDIPLIKAEWFIDSYWYYRFITPFGHILDEGESPYKHGEHPYVFKAYPFIDGEIHSFVNDIIDQQRYVNRLIILYDFIMSSSAKGALLFPIECLPENMSLSDIAESWARFDGLIAIKAKPGQPLPQQISSNSTNIGITDLLNLQLKFFEEISGVNGPLQGKTGYSGTSAALYAQQTQNATTSLLDILESFSDFVITGAYKDVKNIQQFYDSNKIFNIAGRAGRSVVYDPNKISDIDFDISIVESTSSPVYRDLANDFLKEIWASGQITLKQMLEVGDYPFADKLLQSIASQEEKMMNGQQEGLQIPQEISSQLQGGNTEQLYNMLRQ